MASASCFNWHLSLRQNSSGSGGWWWAFPFEMRLSPSSRPACVGSSPTPTTILSSSSGVWGGREHILEPGEAMRFGRLRRNQEPCHDLEGSGLAEHLLLPRLGQNILPVQDLLLIQRPRPLSLLSPLLRSPGSTPSPPHPLLTASCPCCCLACVLLLFHTHKEKQVRTGCFRVSTPTPTPTPTDSIWSTGTTEMAHT